MIKAIDVLRVMAEHKESEFEFRIYSPNTEQGYSDTELSKLPAYVEAHSTLAKLRGDEKMTIQVTEFFESDFQTIASFKMDGQLICERKAYGQPMEAINHALFEQGAYSEMVEQQFMGVRTGRTIFVPEMNESTANGLMKEFIAWREKDNQ
ncbi:hypothetical protein [Lactococcus lactis]|uniref:hypothetical protein n=1 Tax=Lactococcus lactis TaxID=1358 RepID=UPI002417CC74|nr:hypothetical protein [Lactococcus lactis]MDG4969796.1 hypothetical protein [Lactococcus lactis]MDG5103674.1 hypothetical protein [Lactococcus lactis]